MKLTNERGKILLDSLFCTFGLLITAVYGLTDAFFVSKLGKAASAAVGIAFPVQLVVQATGFTLGMGGGSLISRALGAKRRDDAAETAWISLFWSALIGIAIAVCGLCFPETLLSLLGAKEEVAPLAKDYLHFLLLAAPFTAFGFVLNQLLRSIGSCFLAMTGLLIGGVLNLLFDPFLIFSFSLGIRGAAISSLVGSVVSCAFMAVALLIGRRKILPISLHFPRSFWKKSGKILYFGLPSLFRQGLLGLAAFLQNRAAAGFGVAALAALSTVSRIHVLLMSFGIGIGQGVMPHAGFATGEKDPDKIRRVYLFALALSTGVLLLLSIPTFVFAPTVIGWFRKDAEIVRIGAWNLRALALVLCLHGAITCTNMVLQAIGKAIPASIIAAGRQGIFFLPLILTLPRFWGLDGLIPAQAIADGLTFLLTVPFAILLIRKKSRFLKNAVSEKKPDAQSG